MEDVSNFQDLLPTYYARLFPFDDYYRWLSYGNSNMFSRREFSFTLQDDIYIRFQSFKTQQELEAEIKRLTPHKIDIGAVYNKCPKDQRRELKIEPVERELIFDIDMTDYDEVRTCCSGADICNKCWQFMSLACKILDKALKDDFGFIHILWIFSGRRGVHCWVCDEEARSMTDLERASVADYLQLVGGGDYKKKKVTLFGDKIPSSVDRALKIIEPKFIPMCIEEQNILGITEQIEKFLQILPEEDARQELRTLFDQCDSSLTRWNTFVKYIKDKKSSGDKKWYQYRHIIEEIMIQYSYPRLDINVTKGTNHLLKSPFCVHPKTGKVCIPFTVATVDKFHPDHVPTLETLIEEINTFDQKEKINDAEAYAISAKRIKDYKKTSLKKSLHIFNEFLWNMELDVKKAAKRKNEASLEF